MIVSVAPSLLRWARTRASLKPSELARRLGLVVTRIEEWEESGRLSLTHLNRLAEKTYTPVGYFFLSTPPEEALPVADFRSTERRGNEPSLELLDTIRQCELRQQWFRDYLIGEREEPLEFVGSATPDDDPADVGVAIRSEFNIGPEDRAAFRNWEAALGEMFRRVEDGGVLVMRNGVVGNNTHRKLSVDEFRGFAIADEYAPLVFVNAADSKSAQMFTLAHELCHIWLGQSALSDADPQTALPIERFCNAVAAELLVPAGHFQEAWRKSRSIDENAQALSRYYKVSKLVILIRAREADVITRSAFEEAYHLEYAASKSAPSSTGGDFYLTQRSRLGVRFPSAVAASAIEGKMSYSEAFELLNVRKASTFDEIARQMGVIT